MYANSMFDYTCPSVNTELKQLHAGFELIKRVCHNGCFVKCKLCIVVEIASSLLGLINKRENVRLGCIHSTLKKLPI